MTKYRVRVSWWRSLASGLLIAAGLSMVAGRALAEDEASRGAYLAKVTGCEGIVNLGPGSACRGELGLVAERET